MKICVSSAPIYFGNIKRQHLFYFMVKEINFDLYRTL